MATPKIRAANAASPSSLAPDLPRTITNDHTTFLISLHRAPDLSQPIQTRLYSLFHENMGPLSNTSSLDYTESSKREELFDDTGRILLLRRSDERSLSANGEGEGDGGVDMPGKLPDPKGKGKGKQAHHGDGGDIVGYVSFRFDTEETLGPRDAEVIYCYELQLDSRVRGRGLGKILMDQMEAIGKRRKMDKGMLTCLKANEGALTFYRKQGYQPDEIDPTRMDEADSGDGDEEEEDDWEQVRAEDEEGEGVDYVILSKSFR